MCCSEQESKQSRTDRHYFFIIKKKKNNAYWDRLLKQSRKVPLTILTRYIMNCVMQNVHLFLMLQLFKYLNASSNSFITTIVPF